MRTCGSCQATLNQCSVKFEIGQLSMFERLKAYSTMSPIGTNKNARTIPTQMRSATRRPRGSIYTASSAPRARAQSR